MRISDWSSDVCSSDLTDQRGIARRHRFVEAQRAPREARRLGVGDIVADRRERRRIGAQPAGPDAEQVAHCTPPPAPAPPLVATRARNRAPTTHPIPNRRIQAIEAAVRASETGIPWSRERL